MRSDWPRGRWVTVRSTMGAFMAARSLTAGPPTCGPVRNRYAPWAAPAISVRSLSIGPEALAPVASSQGATPLQPADEPGCQRHRRQAERHEPAAQEVVVGKEPVPSEAQRPPQHDLEDHRHR